MSYETEKAWRQSLKEGSGVVVTGRGMNRRMSTGVVERATATQVIVRTEEGRQIRFGKEHGREVGSTYGQSISPITDDARARIRADKNRQNFTYLTLRVEKLADDEIAVMLAAIQELRDSKAVQS